ncbi:type II toxin-antitoxin system RelE/ParE family toxin [Mycetocola tolaasinivorans]|uniref:Type II toxin-antitoxin system RelE/ParE family toxin n=1 Tax=Mycetocola tolaasinivorans TaxID=76635 RepID=A0A3L7ABB3_9MICO|nr:type II toxin-antitoxin system RelE/ParE family toxin [Mycetocola tolaasinivorans]RLP77285.1 type II toxin-antitoxin system RelE/ParE family toxin [Mycetocola tolaasinivorans]
MARRVVTTLSADHDIEAAVDYYIEQDAFDAATRLVSTLDTATGMLAAHPNLGSPKFAEDAGVPGLLSLALQHFPYIIFYTEDPEIVRIHRVLNSQRDIFAQLAHT